MILIIMKINGLERILSLMNDLNTKLNEYFEGRIVQKGFNKERLKKELMFQYMFWNIF